MFRVLIVDDEEDIREGLKIIIDWEKQGFVVTGLAENGIQALELYKKDRPSLVITDIKMPGMDGLELARQLRSLSEDVKILIVSGYDDFSYAKEAMKYGIENYILKPVDNEELCRELDTIREELYQKAFSERNIARQFQELRDYFLTRLVRGELSEKSVQIGAKEYKIEGEAFCTMVLELGESMNEAPDPFENDLELKMFSIVNIVNELMEELSNTIVFRITETKFGFLLYQGEAPLGLEKLKVFARRAMECIQKYIMQYVWIGIGGTVHSLQHILISFKQAEKALEMRLYNGDKHIWSYDEIHSEEAIWTIKWNIADLMQAVQNCDKKHINEQIESLFSQFVEKSVSVNSILQFQTGIIIELAKMTLDNGGNWELIYKNAGKDSNFSNKHENVENIKQSLIDLCMQVAGEIEKAGAGDKNIDDIIKYINQYYYNDLSLKKLAEIFFISASYLGKVIKKETGKTFNDILNDVRIQNAVKLLKDSSLSISEISGKVGYNYIDHFYRNFRTITGTSPGEFRRNPKA